MVVTEITETEYRTIDDILEYKIKRSEPSLLNIVLR